jgi:cytosine/adenosine deaminase-related metal-dependent hydrolase
VVGVKDGRITLVDKSRPTQAGKIIDAIGCLVLPGLVNTHTHLPMVCFRGMADDLPLMDWLTNHIFPAEARFVNKKMVYDGAVLAMAEMILSGTTTLCDGDQGRRQKLTPRQSGNTPLPILVNKHKLILSTATPNTTRALQGME